jgi:hypothetical protein
MPALSMQMPTARIAPEPLAADFFDWIWPRWPTVDTAMHWANICPSNTLAETRFKAEHRREREKRARENGHWSFDMNRLIALDQLVKALDEYEESL